MEFVVGALALLAGWLVCWIQMGQARDRLESPAESLRESVLGLMSELAQAKEIQMAILTDLEKALDQNSEMRLELDQEKEKVLELRSQLASLLETEIRMDSTPEPVMGLELGSGKWLAKPDQSAFLSGSALVDQELDLD